MPQGRRDGRASSTQGDDSCTRLKSEVRSEDVTWETKLVWKDTVKMDFKERCLAKLSGLTWLKIWTCGGSSLLTVLSLLFA